MQDINTPPFYDNQKIIRIGPSKNGLIKGNVYTAGVCQYCNKCGFWKVPIKEFLAPARNYETCNCGNVQNNVAYYSGIANLFAPAETHYVDISKEISDLFKQTDERPDKIMVPEKVN